MAVDFVVVTSGPFVGKVRVDMAIGGKNAGRVRSGKRLVQGGAVTIRGEGGSVAAHGESPLSRVGVRGRG